MNPMSEAPKSAPKSGTRRKWPRWLVWTGWSVLGALVAVALTSLATLFFGAVQGVELNPYSLARRSYFFYEIPLVRWQVRGIRREDVGSIVVDFLEGENFPLIDPFVLVERHAIGAAKITPVGHRDAQILERAFERVG